MSLPQLDQLVSSSRPSAPRILLYGEVGMGKTTFASGAPKPLIFNLEDGGGILRHPITDEVIDVPATPQIQGYDEFVSWLEVLERVEKGKFQTAVFDSLSRLEVLIHRKVCDENGWDNIDSPGFGAGYVAANKLWEEVLDTCDRIAKKQNIAIVFIGHSKIQNYKSPTGESYDRHALALHKGAASRITASVDMSLFIRQDTQIIKKKEGKATRYIADAVDLIVDCSTHPAHDAKNRYGFKNSIPAFFDYVPAIMAQNPMEAVAAVDAKLDELRSKQTV